MSWLPKLGSAGAKVLGLAALLLSGAVTLRAQVAYINEYPISPASVLGVAITAGPDGALWFPESNSNLGGEIGRITTAGVITGYPIPGAYGGPYGITAGPDGALWFADYNSSKIGRITTAGVIAEYPTPAANSGPWGITAGPDGALWFTEWTANKIGRITTVGIITEFPTNGCSRGITAGPDGALWFTGYCADYIGRITTAGIITEYPIPTAKSSPYGITVGSDGALWFTEYYFTGKIGRITTAGVITEYPIPTAYNTLEGIVRGPDGALWFIENWAGKIGQVVLSVPPTPPSVSCTATPNTLWPPNGKSVSVTVSGTVTAGTSALVSTASTVSDEYGQVQPSGGIALGSGGSYSFALSLIAARNGNDQDGRTYTIVVSSKDTLGNVGSCSAVVTVPHDQGN